MVFNFNEHDYLNSREVAYAICDVFCNEYSKQQFNVDELWKLFSGKEVEDNPPSYENYTDFTKLAKEDRNCYVLIDLICQFMSTNINIPFGEIWYIVSPNYTPKDFRMHHK